MTIDAPYPNKREIKAKLLEAQIRDSRHPSHKRWRSYYASLTDADFIFMRLSYPDAKIKELDVWDFDLDIDQESFRFACFDAGTVPLPHFTGRTVA